MSTGCVRHDTSLRCAAKVLWTYVSMKNDSSNRSIAKLSTTSNHTLIRRSPSFRCGRINFFELASFLFAPLTFKML